MPTVPKFMQGQVVAVKASFEPETAPVSRYFRIECLLFHGERWLYGEYKSGPWFLENEIRELRKKEKDGID